MLYGKAGSGKTTVACKIADMSGIPYIKYMSSEDLVGFTDFGKIKVIQNNFNNGYRSPVSLIILDEIERMLEYVSLGSRFNNNILQCLLTFLKKLPEKIGNKIIIIGTTSDKHILKELGIWECFNMKVELPTLTGLGDIQTALKLLVPAFEGVDGLPIDKKLNIPIKNLYFISNFINQKLASDPHADVKEIFLNILGQIQDN
jgi:vesicle-fusing ATPase